MTAFQFVHDERELVGDLTLGSGPLGVVHCAPFGQEASRILRFQRVLTERCLRLGISTLRFDYFGAGESMGDDHDADLDGWAKDLLAADQALRARSPCQKVVWLGMRLGGTVAMRAAALARQQRTALPEQLLLWEPVIDGPAYLETLKIDQWRMVKVGYGMAWQTLGPAMPEDGGGFELGNAMRSQLLQLNLRSALPDDPPSTLITGEAQRIHFASMAPTNTVVVGPAMDWVMDKEEEIEVVPKEAMKALIDLLRPHL